MNDNPLVSIIVPSYNNEKYLPGCLDSLIRQTYRNLEIIVVNDGSKDHTREILDEYAHNDKRIHAIHQKNGGLPCARNAGMDLAAGEFITFVDSDDSLKENAIETLVNLADEETDLVIGSYTELWLYEKEHINSSKRLKYETIDTDFLDFIAHFVFVWRNLYRKSIIDQHSLRFKPGMNFAEDCYFNIYYFKYMTHDVVISSTPIYNYYTYRSSQHRRYFPDMLYYYTDILDAAKDFFEGKEYKTEYRKFFARFYLDTLIDYYSFNTAKQDAENKLYDAYKICQSYFGEEILREILTPQQYSALSKHTGNFIDSYYGKKLPYLKIKGAVRDELLNIKKKIML